VVIVVPDDHPITNTSLEAEKPLITKINADETHIVIDFSTAVN
jgi:hypothetical protein